MQCVVRAHPSIVVRVTEKKGPRDITAKFAGGTGAVEDRSFEGPYLYVVQARSTGRVVLDVIPYGFKDAKEIVSVTLDVDDGTAPVPPPKPDDKKDKKDTDPPKPTTPTKLYVVIVEETADAASTARGVMLLDPALSARMKEKGHHWRIVDQDVIDKDGKPPADVKRFLDDAKGKALPQMYLVDEEGETRWSGPKPKTTFEILKSIQAVGG